MSDEESIEIENRLSRPDQPRGFPSVAQVVGVWREKFEKGVLNNIHFKEHWRLYVPRVLNLDPSTSCLENIFDEENVQDILFAPLEEFICDGNPTEVFERIKRLENPPSVCGRVFKLSEPTYNCRECGTDPTCVLCVDCFKKSEHRNHKYKMAMSSGGGCCDCGDTEAWKNYPYCSIHVVGSLDDADNGSQFPEDIRKRTRITFRAILQYAYQLLSIDHETTLPIDLRLRRVEDDSFDTLGEQEIFCTVLYNDETHTFDHVISTLLKVIKCSQKDAIDYVTSIDREGRAVVKCASFQKCTELKSEVERFTGRSSAYPLKVQVKSSHVVAHQLYALKLLSWLQKVLSCSKNFRDVFAEVLLESKKKKSADISILEGILLRDSMLWKSARVHWHKLFICGMLKEYENKKSFATVFTKHYGSIMKDFIRDDHDHGVSVAALSVQIYTVRTIAHHLIAKQDVLFVLLNTFWSECGSFIKDNKLEFQRNEHSSSTTFKRAQFIIFDLHYLLNCVPDEWTQELRKGFVDGLLLFLKLLSAMQGMDSVTRQVGQHMEYEPEWETAFNLHNKLSSVITSMIKWCGTDRIVLIKSYRATLRKLHESPCPGLNEPGVIREIADHSTTCINYDVSEKPVSIHLPLSRFLAGLYVQLEKHGLQFYSCEFNSTAKQTPEQIIEPVLRTQVMIAQVHAGLWRRNGYSILHQIYFYHNVKCRNEMLNKDIILLQFGASLIESNDFLIHLLNKFKLMEWADPDFETSLKRIEDDSLRQTIMLVQEFLALLIMIVSERYVVGVGKVTEKDCIKKEIIQQLCIKPLSHSELSKALPENDNRDTNFDTIIEEVATFQKPLGAGKGLYKLKPEYYNQYNVFFYHYTKEELSKSEEAQRKRSKEESSLDCCIPPSLPPLTDVFAPMLVNLLQCDVMFYIIQLVLKRACDLNARSFSESQLHRVLYLVGLSLQEEQSGNYDYFVFTERCEKWNIIRYLKDLHKNSRVEAYRDLIKWTIVKYKEVSSATSALRAQKNAAMAASSAEEGEKMEVEESAIADSDTVTNEEDGNEDHMKKEKERIAKLAAERRMKIMAQMSSAQKTFMKENAKLFEEASAASKLKCEEMCWKSTESVEFPVALGPNQTLSVSADPMCTCILCQEHQVVKSDAPAMVFGAFIQKSSVLKNEFNSPVQTLKPKELTFLQSSLSPSIFVSICGHVMHSTCFEKYFLNLSTKESRRTYRLRQPISFDVEKEEFLCPLCESLNNAILPVLPPLGNVIGASKPVISEQITFETWLNSLIKATEKKQQELIEKQKSVSSDSKRTKEVKKQNDLVTDGGLVETSFDDVQNDDQDSMDTIESFVNADENRPFGSSGMVWDDDVETSSDVTSFPQAAAERTSAQIQEDIEVVLLMNPTENMDLSEGAAAEHKPIISDSLRNMITTYTKSVCTKGLDEMDVDVNRSTLILYCWKSCAYTIHVVEVLLRNENRSLLGDLPTRQKKCIKSLLRLSTMQEICRNQRIVNIYALMLLSVIFDCNHHFKKACILDWDPFGMLVSLVMSQPSLFCMQTPAFFPNGSVLDLYAVKLMLIATVTQILIGVDMEDDNETEDECQFEYEDTECLRWYLKVLKRPDHETINTARLWRHVTKFSLSFLRCSCIFFRYLTGVHPPECLKQVSEDTYKRMCKYLGLPETCKELLDNESAKKVFEKWTEKWQIRQQAQKTPLKYETYFHHRGLITLPKDYSELINSVSLFTCPNSDHEDSRNPTLCLVCGTMLCSQSYCCQKDLQGSMVGACAHHAYTCGAGAGIFLRIRECEILLLSCPNRGCFLPPPYLDEYGETDQGLRRGNPLKLCPVRYKKLENIWLQHSIHEEVSRSLESSHTLTVTQWQHL